MIIRTQPNGQLFCVNQTSHALMAAEFCRHWGNREFATPSPFELVINAIAQHDNGWFEWEAAPQVDATGAPIDFIPGLAYDKKLEIWQRGINRAAAQHPYMGLMTSRHATLLYVGDLLRMEGEERRVTQAFLAKQEAWTQEMRHKLAGDAELVHAAAEPVLMAHTRVLQFGDSSSLQVIVPWSNERIFPDCPVDFVGTYTSITLRWAEQAITFDPWPFGVDHFTVSIHGRLLDQSTFPNHAAYQAALAAAPWHRLIWHVTPNA